MTKSQIAVCFVGHVDSGKSTTVGNLIYQLGYMDERKLDKLKKEAEAKGKGSFYFAFATDTNETERQRGITVNSKLVKIETSKYVVNIHDCPGHRDFIKNMITGTNQSDCAIAIVPIGQSDFSAAYTGGTLTDHILICGVLGVRRVICCINKVDTIKEEEQEKAFNFVASEMKMIINKIHPDKDPIIIPISGMRGTNIIENGEKFSWFKGWKAKNAKDPQVFTLEGALNFVEPPARRIDAPMRLNITNILKIAGKGTVLTGQVVQGTFKVGQKIVISPLDIEGEVKTIEIHHEDKKEAIAGDNIGFTFKITKNADKMSHLKVGAVISDPNNKPMSKCRGFEVQAIVVDHPNGIKTGYKPTMDIGTAHLPVSFGKFLKKKSKDIKEPIENPDIIMKNESFSAVMISDKDIMVETTKECPDLARFALRDSGKVVVIGAITNKLSKDDLIKMGLIKDDVKKVAPAAAGKKDAKGKKAAPAA